MNGKRTQVGTAGRRFGNKARLILGVQWPRLCSLGEGESKEEGAGARPCNKSERVTVTDKQNGWGWDSL